MTASTPASKSFFTRLLLLSALFMAAGSYCEVDGQTFKHIKSTEELEEAAKEELEELVEPEVPDSIPIEYISPDSLAPDSVVDALYLRFPPKNLMPRIFSGYRSMTANKREFTLPPFAIPDTTEHPLSNPIPDWLKASRRAGEIREDLEYNLMIQDPLMIEYAYWDLPVPPKLPEDDHSYAGYLRSLDLPTIDVSGAVLPTMKMDRRYWLHYFNTGIQFSQAYVSDNWYQGGNNYLALLFNFTWNVDLNTVYHPNLLFKSSLTYKLALNSTPKGSLHKYSITQDDFQYNLNLGLKALKHWFYSFNLQFRTPFFNAYPDNSEIRKGSFLAPGSLNLGLGMTYTLQNAKKTFNLTMAISPLSYNLKTCIVPEIDHAQYNIEPWRKTASEVGSNLEANMRWQIRDNILWTSRLFLFTDYNYFLADWENTFNFQLTKFLSTQIYLHPRYDSSSNWGSSKWHYWMFKEILSFGLSYTFSTKG